MLVILDCVYHEGDDFYEPIMTQLVSCTFMILVLLFWFAFFYFIFNCYFDLFYFQINNLQTFWDKFECSPMNFSNFKLKFPSVPAHISRLAYFIFSDLFVVFCSVLMLAYFFLFCFIVRILGFLLWKAWNCGLQELFCKMNSQMTISVTFEFSMQIEFSSILATSF